MVEQIQLLLDDTYNPVVVDSFLDTRRDLSFSLKGGIEDSKMINIYLGDTVEL